MNDEPIRPNPLPQAMLEAMPLQKLDDLATEYKVRLGLLRAMPLHLALNQVEAEIKRRTQSR